MFFEALSERGVGIRLLDQNFDTSTREGKFMLSVLGAVAEYLRALIVDRTSEGRQAALARGVQFGRPRVMDAASTKRARELYASGLTQQEIANVLGVSRMTVHNY